MVAIVEKDDEVMMVNCPICNDVIDNTPHKYSTDNYCSHKVGPYEVIYGKWGNKVNQIVVLKIHPSRQYFLVPLQFDGFVYMDEQRIDRLLILK